MAESRRRVQVTVEFIRTVRHFRGFLIEGDLVSGPLVLGDLEEKRGSDWKPVRGVRQRAFTRNFIIFADEIELGDEGNTDE